MTALRLRGQTIAARHRERAERVCGVSASYRKFFIFEKRKGGSLCEEL